MKNRTTLDQEALKREKARDTLMRNLLSGVPHELPTSRMELLNEETMELLHKPLVELLYGDSDGVLHCLDTFAVSGSSFDLSPFTSTEQPVVWQGINFYTYYDTEYFRQICLEHPREQKLGRTELQPWRLAEEANLPTIFGEILGCNPLENWELWVAKSVNISTILTAIKATERALKDGIEPRLPTGGCIDHCINVFPIPYQINGQPAVVRCYRSEPEVIYFGRCQHFWDLLAVPFNFPGLWVPGSRFFSRAG